MVNYVDDVVEVVTSTGRHRHYQLRIYPDKPIVVCPIHFGRADTPLQMGSEEWREATDAYKARDTEPTKGLVGEMRCKGKTHKVYKGYDIFVDGVLTQRNLTPDDFVRWACNALEDGS